MMRVMAMWMVAALPAAVLSPQPTERPLDRVTGRYEGSGNWFEDTGKTMGYVVNHAARATDRGFEVEFTHDFADKTRVHAVFNMIWRTRELFDVQVGANVVGHGYCLENTCSYHIKTGQSFVEVSYRPTATGLEVYGSSSANADGHYIVWHESLRKAP